MKHVHSQGSLETTTYKTSHFAQTTRCFESTSTNEIEIHLANRNFKQEEEYVLPVTIDQYDIIDIFELTANQIKMQMIEKEENYATAIIKNSKNAKLSDYFNCLAWWANKKTNITAIKINIHQNRNFHNQQVRLCRLKILGKNNEEITTQFIHIFKEKMQKADAIFKQPFPYDLLPVQERIQQNQTNPFHLQTCAYHILHQILMENSRSEQKGVNWKLEESLRQFYDSFKNISESSDSLPTPMVNAIEISKQITEQIRIMIKDNKAYNIDYRLLLPYLKIAVEKHIFDKVGNLLKQIYFQNTRKQSIIFTQKSTKIKQNLSISEIFDEILLPKHLQIVKNKSAIKEKGLSEKQMRQNVGFAGLAYQIISLDALSKISNPREKIKSCQIMYAELKSYLYEQLNKKYQLNSMEDIIPVFIVIVLFCGTSGDSNSENSEISLRAQLNMMIDFMNTYSEQFEAEKRLIINISESYNYIIRDWQI